MSKAFTHYQNVNISMQIVEILKSNFGASAVDIREVEMLVKTVSENKDRATITREMMRGVIESKKARNEVNNG